ncbi:hypothetical protein IFM89_009616 [Coptis chinensis]|uniref:SBP-type domain-containing protein n=1 Tax=Coptis chinensis TaxID=261450 RepID=A0A835IW49_9MAGN|nr:hypothetical protein IFM89_009616 [Coptis chinensis]
MHSKTPRVIVNGLEQRFCQQCSRFHLLTEFDQGKRSCRRRLAGHNERRRKSQPGSLFTSRYGRLSPSFQENSSRGGGFLMDFTRQPGRDDWPIVKTGNWADGNQPTPTGKLLPHQWQGDPRKSSSYCLFSRSSDHMRKVAIGGTDLLDTRIPFGECFAGGLDSVPLSLRQINHGDLEATHPILLSIIWAMKLVAVREMPHDFGPGRVSQSMNNHFSVSLR